MAIRMTRYAHAVQFADKVVVKSQDAEEYLEQNFMSYIDVHPSNIFAHKHKYFLDDVERGTDTYEITFHVIKELCPECVENDNESLDECDEHVIIESVRFESIYLAEQVDIRF